VLHAIFFIAHPIPLNKLYHYHYEIRNVANDVLVIKFNLTNHFRVEEWEGIKLFTTKLKKLCFTRVFLEASFIFNLHYCSHNNGLQNFPIGTLFADDTCPVPFD